MTSTSATKLIAETGLAWYSGDDGLLLPFLSVGGAGIVSVSAHVVGAHFAETVRRFDAGDIAGAVQVFRTATGVIDALNGAGAQAVMAKAAVEARRHHGQPLPAPAERRRERRRGGRPACGPGRGRLCGATPCTAEVERARGGRPRHRTR